MIKFNIKILKTYKAMEIFGGKYSKMEASK
jgi:hypothetical protein